MVRDLLLDKYNGGIYADMAKLVDALDLGSSALCMGVRVSLSAIASLVQLVEYQFCNLKIKVQVL
jgi:hypothetical protein